MSTELLDKPTDINTNDPENVAHIVTPKSAVTESAVMGTKVRALCGYEFVVTRDLTEPICKACLDVYQSIGASGA